MCRIAALFSVAMAILVGSAFGRVTHGATDLWSHGSLRTGRFEQAPEDLDSGNEIKDEGSEQSSKMVRKAKESPEELPKDFARDMEMLHETFIPDFKPNVLVIAGTMVVVAGACLWYALYFFVFYKHDRRLETAEEKARTKKLAEDKQSTILGGHFDRARFTSDCRPDMVIVFQKPDCEKYDQDRATEISADRVSQIFRTETSELKFRHFDHAVETDTTPDWLNLVDVRTALLKDLHEVLRNMGFAVEAFSSIDKDEIFLCISLVDEELVKSFIVSSHMDLQLSHPMISKLGIGDCADDCAAEPPFIRYDPWAVTQLHKQGVIEEDDPRQMFETYHARDPKGCLLGSQERFRVIYRKLSDGFDLDTAKSNGVIADWYPAHSRNRLRRLALIWGDMRLITDFTFQQPINEINNYFGTRVSFLFAWNGVYCKALLALIPPAIFWSCAGFVACLYFGVSADEASRQVLGMAIMVLVWAKIAANLWDQEEEFFLKLWGLNSDVKDRIVRAEYKGHLLPAEYDGNINELQASKINVILRRLVSALITFLFILLVLFAIMLWLSVFNGNMNLVAAICLSIKIKMFEVIWNILCPLLTEFENPKYADDYYNSFLIKMFLFGFVNNYWAFFFLAIKQKYTVAGCPVGGCLWAVRKQLIITLAILSACRVFQVVVEALLVKFMLWWEDRCLKKALGTQDIPKRSYVEEQCKYSDFSAAEQVQNMIQLIVPLGYVLMFGGIAPFIIPMAFFIFAFSLRAGGYTLITASKRPVPRETYGIGAWREVAIGLMIIGLLFNGFLLAAYGEMLHGTYMITRMSIAGVFCLFVCLIWAVIDYFIPPTCKSVEIMAARRKRVLHKFEEELAHSTVSQTLARKNSMHYTESDKALQDGNWNSIRTAADIVEEDLGSHLGSLTPAAAAAIVEEDLGSHLGSLTPADIVDEDLGSHHGSPRE